GSVFAGYILGRIQNRPAFDQIPALFIMVPVLLNLKSNIELNMSTRLSTQANLGVFERKSDGISTM
ncbi:EH domain-containing protein 4, partial [Coemansia sp. RSA 25]